MNQVAVKGTCFFVVTQFHLVMLPSSYLAFIASQGHTEVPPVPCPLVRTGHLALLPVGGLGDLGFLKDIKQAEVPVPRVGRAQTSQLVSRGRV